MVALCVSIDVERDFRVDGRLTTRGIDEGLPAFLETLNARSVPYDLFVSGEVASLLPPDLPVEGTSLASLGCHGLTHNPGVRSYLSQWSRGRQLEEIRRATEAVRGSLGRRPQYFRAPNFSANGETIAVLEELGYRADSSVLPGRHVRRWRVISVLDHRCAPLNPYYPCRESIVKRGSAKVLEVPVTPNPMQEGSPLGLGLLHASGLDTVLRAIRRSGARYIVFLAHTWEMVDWDENAPVAPWVRTAARSDIRPVVGLISRLDEPRFLNVEMICNEQREQPVIDESPE